MKVLTALASKEVQKGTARMLLNQKEGANPSRNFRNFAKYMSAIFSGIIQKESGIIAIDCEYYYWDLSYTGQPTAAQAATINGVAFAAVASSPTGNQFLIGADANATYNNLIAAVNASVTAKIKNVMSAERIDSDTIRIKLILPGEIGSLATFSENLDNATSAATSGSQGNFQNI